MKIVCFPHYTCGGLLCDILNNTFSKIGANGGILSIEHAIGKLGDSDTVYTDFDINDINRIAQNNSGDKWIGTHCWLGKADLSIFDQVINITTVTFRSQLYRWIRAYHHYYLESEPWQNLSGLDAVDKQRETAKNYLIAFEKITNERVINIEFADVVEQKASFVKLLPGNYQPHLDRWQQVNSFLYTSDLWLSTAAIRFHEAQHEMLLDTRYVYE